MSLFRRAVVSAVVLGAGLASTAGLASAAPSVPGVDGAVSAAQAAAAAGTAAGLAGGQAGLDAGNAAAAVATTLAGVPLPGLDQLPVDVSDLPGLTEGLDAIPSPSDLGDLGDLTDPTAFADLLTGSLPTAETLTAGLPGLGGGLPGAQG
ncbi:hypothetical protein [Actinomycetospora atypica]|uniref:ATP-binding protein n=1 Tax=Actinomycetospora atypica TaxID=1290095 RepID=A0ABV9YRE2_9PSEU